MKTVLQEVSGCMHKETSPTAVCDIPDMGVDNGHTMLVSSQYPVSHTVVRIDATEAQMCSIVKINRTWCQGMGINSTEAPMVRDGKIVTTEAPVCHN